MPVRLRVPAPPGGSSWEALRDELGVVDAFPADALAEAVAAAAAPRLPDLDRTDVELCTIDPAGSRDLDQAVGFERTPSGFLVRYAIADVAAFVTPGGALDLEAHRRGETLYGPDVRVPMLPPELCEGAASLLPGERRPALLWELQLDATGELVGTHVARAVVRSRRQLTYEGVQATYADDDQLSLLREVGMLRMALGVARGAVDLPSLEQEVHLDPGGSPRLDYRATFESERWNAQISLLTGIAAARLMVDGKVGVLRTLPAPAAADIEQLRHSAVALGVPWADGATYGEVVTGLDPHDPHHAALLALVPRLLRGAGYMAFDGDVPADHDHSGIAAAYAHCTAPLRRLVDRYAGEVCVALCAKQPVPTWTLEALPKLPEEMAAADHRAHQLERATIDLAEAMVLAPHVGETFDATIVSTDDDGKRGTVQLAEPAVRATVTGTALQAGAAAKVRLDAADPATRKVRFALA